MVPFPIVCFMIVKNTLWKGSVGKVQKMFDPDVKLSSHFSTIIQHPCFWLGAVENDKISIAGAMLLDGYIIHFHFTLRLGWS